MVFAIWMIAGGVFGAVTGWLAVDRNRSAVPWWFLGSIFGPIALVTLFVKGKRTDAPPAVL